MRSQNLPSVNIMLDNLQEKMVRWTCLPRTPLELAKLCRASLCTCSAKDQALYAHSTGQAIFTDSGHKWPILCLGEVLMYSISISIMKNPPVQAARVDKVAKRTLWPTDTKQILPYGPEDTIRGLLCWLDQDIGDKASWGALFEYLRVVLIWTYPLTFPYVLTSHTLIHSGVIPTLNRERGHIAAMQGKLKIDDLSRSLLALQACAHLLRQIVRWANKAQRQELVGSHAQLLLDTIIRFWIGFDEMYSYVRADELKHTADGLDVFASCLMQDFPALRTIELPHGRPHHHLKFGDTPWETLLLGLYRLHNDNKCASPDCARTIASSEPRFWLCGGCRRVVYCSRRCQKQAWKHPSAPHRLICGPLRSICTVNHLARNLVLSKIESRFYTEPNSFNPHEAAMIDDHLGIKTRYEMATLRVSSLRSLTNPD
jgi:hypothetical protein